jgi:hypothetical protein
MVSDGRAMDSGWVTVTTSLSPARAGRARAAAAASAANRGRGRGRGKKGEKVEKSKVQGRRPKIGGGVDVRLSDFRHWTV